MGESDDVRLVDERAAARPEGLLGRLDTRLPLRLLGFGFMYAWSTCLWDIPLGSAISPVQRGDVWLLSAILTPLTCLAALMLGCRRELDGAPHMGTVAGTLCSIGTVAVIVVHLAGQNALPPAVSFALSLIGGLGTGIGPALLILLWTYLFARIDEDIVETVVPASFIVTLLCALVIPALPAPLGVCALVTLPLASAFCLALSRHSCKTQALPPAQSQPSRSLTGGGSTLRLFVVVFAIDALGCAAPAVAVRALPWAVESYATMAGMLFAVGLSAIIVLFARRINLDTLYQAITVPFVLGVVALALESDLAALIARILMNVVFTGTEILIVLYIIRLAHRSDKTITFLASLGEGAAYAGVLAGYLLQPLLATVDALPLKLFGCLVILALFALTSLLVPHHNALFRLHGECRAVEDDPLGAIEQSREEERESVASSYSAEMDALIARRTAMAREHGLSNRETEIFLLLAQGRSRPYIRDALYLSKNTVATHIRHIYEKLGIHSQQELIDLVEA